MQGRASTADEGQATYERRHQRIARLTVPHGRKSAAEVEFEVEPRGHAPTRGKSQDEGSLRARQIACRVGLARIVGR